MVKDIMTQVLYKHENGTWHNKLVHTEDDLKEVKESSFVDEVLVLSIKDEIVISDKDRARVLADVAKINTVRIYPVLGINPRTNRLTKIMNLEKMASLTKQQIGAANAYLRQFTYGFRIAIMGFSGNFETWYYPELWETGKEEAVLKRRHPFWGLYQ